MNNPLLAPQREKAGSQTLSKYSYQYHWALEKAILEHQKQLEYAIFVEFHEDVVYSTSLDRNEAQFEFNQIKTDAKTFSITKLTRLKNSKSVLGKLLTGTSQKPYSEKIQEINLVAVNGFNFQLKDSGLRFQKMNIDDIASSDREKLREKLHKEIANCKLPASLNFVVPTLKETNHQQVLIGEISELIASLFPSSSYDSTHIYRLLIDDLFRKGQDVFDYKNWEEALARKSLTSQKVTETINEYTSHKGDAAIQIQFLEIARELGYKTIERKEIEHSFIRYKNSVFGSRSPYQLRLSKSIRESIDRNFPLCARKIEKLITLVQNEISVKYGTTLGQKNETTGAIIYEFITKQ